MSHRLWTAFVANRLLSTSCRGLETGTLHGRRQQQGLSGMPLGFTTTYSSMAMPESPLARSSIMASTTTSRESGQPAQEQHQVRSRAVLACTTAFAAPGLVLKQGQHQDHTHSLFRPACTGWVVDTPLHQNWHAAATLTRRGLPGSLTRTALSMLLLLLPPADGAGHRASAFQCCLHLHR